MRVNYMFTVYNEPELLARTVSKLQHPQAYFYIHVDGKKDIEPFLKSLKRLPHVFFLTGDARINVEWGGYQYGAGGTQSDEGRRGRYERGLLRADQRTVLPD